jgi:hypothetical protein
MSESQNQNFAAVVHLDKIGQVVVWCDEVDEPEGSKPVMVFMFSPKGLGVCTLKQTLIDTDEAWEEANMLIQENSEKLKRMAENLILKTTIGNFLNV